MQCVLNVMQPLTGHSRSQRERERESTAIAWIFPSFNDTDKWAIAYLANAAAHMKGLTQTESFRLGVVLDSCRKDSASFNGLALDTLLPGHVGAMADRREACYNMHDDHHPRTLLMESILVAKHWCGFQ